MISSWHIHACIIQPKKTVLFKILLFDSVLSDLKDEGEDEELSQELFGKMQRPSKMEGIKD